MDSGYRQTPASNQRRQTVWLWMLFILLAVLVGCLAYLLVQAVAGRPSASTSVTKSVPTASTNQWGDRYCYAGAPRTTASFPYQITVLTNTGYLVGYCETRKDPVWVCYRLFRPDNLQAPPRPKTFEPDPRTTGRAVSRDYTGSGYDRGHMAPNYAIAVCYGSQAQQETFLMSNIIPQRPALNRQVWERLEQTEIKDYACKYGRVWVIDGPVFHGHDHLKGGEDIPDACYKIICREENGKPTVLAFIMPQTVNGSESAQQYLTSVREIEQETGLDFFSALPADLQQRFEMETARGMW
ncbi:MAG: DNA/RNA non-specific endonuclease [bacterium]